MTAKKKGKRAFHLLKETFSEFIRDAAPRLAAAVAFYTIFSLAPLLLFALAVAGSVWGEEAVRGELVSQISGRVGPTTAAAIQEMIASAAESGAGVQASILGLVALLFGASAVFVQLKRALNRIWNVPPGKKSGIVAAIFARLTAFVVVIGMVLFFVAAMVLSGVVTAVAQYLDLPGGPVLLRIAQFAVFLALLTVLFTLLFRFLPDTRVSWRNLWVGGAVTALLFAIGQSLIGIYLARSTLASSYGAAGSLVVVLLWIYYSALILFFGAEFTEVWSRRKTGEPRRRENEAAWADEPKEKGEQPEAEPRRAEPERPSRPMRPLAAAGIGFSAAIVAVVAVAGLATRKLAQTVTGLLR